MYQQQQQEQQQLHQQSAANSGNPLSNTLRHYSNHELNQTQLARDLRVVSASGNDTYAHLEYADSYRDGGESRYTFDVLRKRFRFNRHPF